MVENLRTWRNKWEVDGTLKKKPAPHDTLLNHGDVVEELIRAYTQQAGVLPQSADFWTAACRTPV